MSTPCSRYQPRRRLGIGPQPGLRVSDSDRSQVADQLSKHYGEGRLDETEFSERLDRAMSAKTQADLSGLLADLPGTDEPGEPRRMRPQRGFAGRLIFLALVFLVAAGIGHALIHAYLLWLLLALAAVLWLRYGPRRGH